MFSYLIGAVMGQSTENQTLAPTASPVPRAPSPTPRVTRFEPPVVQDNFDGIEASLRENIRLEERSQATVSQAAIPPRYLIEYPSRTFITETTALVRGIQSVWERIIEHPLIQKRVNRFLFETIPGVAIQNLEMDMNLMNAIEELIHGTVIPALNSFFISLVEKRYSIYLEGIQRVEDLEVQNKLHEIGKAFWEEGKDEHAFNRLFYQTISKLPELEQNTHSVLCRILGEFTPRQHYKRMRGNILALTNGIKAGAEFIVKEMDEIDRYEVFPSPRVEPLKSLVVLQANSIGMVFANLFQEFNKQLIILTRESERLDSFLENEIVPRLKLGSGVDIRDWISNAKQSFLSFLPRIYSGALRVICKPLDLYFQMDLNKMIKLQLQVITSHLNIYLTTRKATKKTPFVMGDLFVKAFREKGQGEKFGYHPHLLLYASETSPLQPRERFIKEVILPKIYRLMGRNFLEEVLFKELLPEADPYYQAMRESDTSMVLVEQILFKGVRAQAEDMLVDQFNLFIQEWTDPHRMNLFIISKLEELMQEKIVESSLGALYSKEWESYLKFKAGAIDELKQLPHLEKSKYYHLTRQLIVGFINCIIEEEDSEFLNRLREWIMASVLEVFEMIQQPQIAQSLIYHLLESTLQECVMKHLPNGDAKAVMNRPYYTEAKGREPFIHHDVADDLSNCLLMWFQSCMELIPKEASAFDKLIATIAEKAVDFKRDEVQKVINEKIMGKIFKLRFGLAGEREVAVQSLTTVTALSILLVNAKSFLEGNPDWLRMQVEQALAK